MGIIGTLISLPNVHHAQSIKRQCISSYGASSVTDNVLISQTAGQSFNTTVSSNNISVSQGFQQTNTFSLEEINPILFKTLNISVYPNPATRSITISSLEEIAQSFIEVSDISGKHLLTEKVPNLRSHSINCSSWMNGIYLITIFDTQQNSKTLRLIISK